jgi:hypothetical protein
MMGKRCVFGMLMLTVVLALIGLMAFTSESVHRVLRSEQSLTEVPSPHAAPPAPEPAMGPMMRDGLLLTY